MSNQLKGRLMLMGFGLNLSASIIHIILHNYWVAGAALVVSYLSYLYVVKNYVDKVVEEANEQIS